MQYLEELFAQKTPYLQWLKQQETELGRQYGQRLNDKKTSLGKQIYRLPFCSCMDSVRDTDNLFDDKVYLFVKDGGSVSDYAELMMADTFSQNTDAVLVYADEDCRGSLKALYGMEDSAYDAADYRGAPWFKPDFSPDTLVSFFYIGSIFAIRGDVMAETVRTYGENISIYELVYWIFMKELTDRKGSVIHIPKVLYTNNKSCGIQQLLSTDKLKQMYAPNEPQAMVSVIIPSKDNAQILRKCLETLTQYTSYKNYEIIIVDNGSSEGQRTCITDVIHDLQKADAGLAVKYLYQNRSFNFSAMCNMGAKAADGEYLLFLNDDIEIINTNEGAKWLAYMMQYAKKRHVGAVGAKLYYPLRENDNGCYRIQHAGITNMGIGPAHKLGGMMDEGCLYYGHNMLNYDMLAVTAACMLVRRSVFDEAGGFDEGFPVAYNDAAFCFALYQKGYFNVQVNEAVLIHHESLSRGQDTAPEKIKRLNSEKKKLYDRYPALQGRDPFYSPNLVQWKKDVDYNTCYLYEYDKKAEPRRLSGKEVQSIFKRYAFRENLYKKNKTAGKVYDRLTGYNLLMQTIDTIDADEKEIAVNGWCVRRNYDNAQLEKEIWLINNNKGGRTVYAFDILPKLREDVEALFVHDRDAGRMTKNTALCGIHVLFEKQKLERGTYQIAVIINKKQLLYMEHEKGKRIQVVIS